MSRVDGLPKTRPFIDENGLFNTEGRVAQDEIEARIPITGEGTPEGKVSANAGATYYDLTANTGSIHYVKMQDSVAGDSKLGWILA